jgi:hypothetical protein
MDARPTETEGRCVAIASSKTPADKLLQMVIQKWVLSEEEGRALSTMIPPACNVCQAASRKD